MPLTLATVTVVVVTDVAVADAERQTTLVPLAHDDVAQSMPATVPVGVRSAGAKASPLSVAVSPPDDGTLLSPTRAELTAGAAVAKCKSTSLRKLTRREQKSTRNSMTGVNETQQ